MINSWHYLFCKNCFAEGTTDPLQLRQLNSYFNELFEIFACLYDMEAKICFFFETYQN